jgi:hypothetical protein
MGRAKRPHLFYDWSAEQLMLGGVNPSDLGGNAKNGNADLTAGNTAASRQAPHTLHDNR